MRGIADNFQGGSGVRAFFPPGHVANDIERVGMYRGRPYRLP